MQKEHLAQSQGLELSIFFANKWAQSVGTSQTAKLKRPFQQNTPQLITSHFIPPTRGAKNVKFWATMLVEMSVLM